MNTKTRRKVFARLLLAVFSTILCLSAVHIHEQQASPYNTCAECINHVPHSGHISLNVLHTHDCVLCQFLTLPFMAAAALLLALLAYPVAVTPSARPFSLCGSLRRAHTPRAPPVC